MYNIKTSNMNNVTLYIDGFNFYYGIKNRAMKNPRIHVGHSFCNFKQLGENSLLPLLGGNARLNKIKYFTASVATVEKRDKERYRQKWWIKFLRTTIPEIQIIEGFYDAPNERRDRKEKLTDVNIAVSMLLDAFNNEYDSIILMSGDFDLFPAIKAIREEFNREVWILVPPEAKFNRWKREAKRYGYQCKSLTPEMLACNLLPYRVNIDGEEVYLPKEFKWHLPKEYQ